MNAMEQTVKIPVKDILEALSLSSYHELKKRIAEKIYPEPHKTPAGRYIFNLGWLDIAQIREAELKQIIIRIEQRKQLAKKRQEEIIDVLGNM